jgi:ABC-type transport system involved in multi-copper enzyme maturation permease subunit
VPVAQAANDPASLKKAPPSARLAWTAGIVGFSIMTIQGIISTLNPKPDGRLLNTAPSLGFDLFLVVGLLGIGYCIFMLIRSR